ncbi:unnamed protein product, partial [Ectocarpus sp. 12 AP-2014]
RSSSPGRCTPRACSAASTSAPACVAAVSASPARCWRCRPRSPGQGRRRPGQRGLPPGYAPQRSICGQLTPPPRPTTLPPTPPAARERAGLPYLPRRPPGLWALACSLRARIPGALLSPLPGGPTGPENSKEPASPRPPAQKTPLALLPGRTAVAVARRRDAHPSRPRACGRRRPGGPWKRRRGRHPSEHRPPQPLLAATPPRGSARTAVLFVSVVPLRRHLCPPVPLPWASRQACLPLHPTTPGYSNPRECCCIQPWASPCRSRRQPGALLSGPGCCPLRRRCCPRTVSPTADKSQRLKPQSRWGSPRRSTGRPSASCHRRRRRRRRKTRQGTGGGAPCLVVSRAGPATAAGSRPPPAGGCET